MPDSAKVNASIQPRRDILDARALAWERLAAPGPFLDGARY